MNTLLIRQIIFAVSPILNLNAGLSKQALVFPMDVAQEGQLVEEPWDLTGYLQPWLSALLALGCDCEWVTEILLILCLGYKTDLLGGLKELAFEKCSVLGLAQWVSHKWWLLLLSDPCAYLTCCLLWLRCLRLCPSTLAFCLTHLTKISPSTYIVKCSDIKKSWRNFTVTNHLPTIQTLLLIFYSCCFITYLSICPSVFPSINTFTFVDEFLSFFILR